MSTYEETIWCCTTRRGIVDKKHDELKSFGRFWYQKIRDFLNSKHTVQKSLTEFLLTHHIRTLSDRTSHSALAHYCPIPTAVASAPA